MQSDNLLDTLSKSNLTNKKRRTTGENQTVTIPAIKALNKLPKTMAVRYNSGKIFVAGRCIKMGDKGMPDIIGYSHGYFFACETKADARQKLTEDQVLIANRMLADGVIWFRANTPDEAIQKLLIALKGLQDQNGIKSDKSKIS